jgi:predicted 3-demethylubiquinone-9 3-methyltransferase (glyoxalase superfamily)
MELGKYDWSPCYGWLADKFGVEWQTMVGPDQTAIAPCLLFVKESFGQARAALDYYLSIFPGSKITARTPSPDGKLLCVPARRFAECLS